jgi:hypothetical protein
MPNCLICNRNVELPERLRLEREFREDTEKYMEYLTDNFNLTIVEKKELSDGIKILKVKFYCSDTIKRKRREITVFLKLSEKNKRVEVIGNSCRQAYFKKVKKTKNADIHAEIIEKRCMGCNSLILNRASYAGYCTLPCLFKHDSKLYFEKIKKPGREYCTKIEFKQYGLLYLPMSESEVIHLFSKLHESLGFKFIKELRILFPDCIAIDEQNNEIRIEFEYRTSSFLTHKHDPSLCDLIICWEHDWKECPVKVLSFKEYFENKKITSQPPKTGIATIKYL